MTEFSLELNEDQIQIQKWVHDFAENVMRPVAHEWDEREETPWPVIEEAARVGIYSVDFITNCFADPAGLQFSIVSEEMGWGDAGIALAIFGSTLAATAIFANGTPEQVAEWVPQCYGTPDDIKLAAFGVSEPDAGSDVSSLKTRAVYDEAKDEWVLNGTKSWITNGGLANTHVIVASVDPTLGGRGHASFVIPEGTKGIRQGQKYKKMGIRASHTAEVVLEDCRIPGRNVLGGMERLNERLARARSGTHTKTQAAMATFEITRPPVGAQAVGIARAAYEYALDYARGAPAVRSGHHREPGHRVQARRYEDAHRRLPAPRLAGRMDGHQRQAVRGRRGLDVQAVRRGDGRVGDRAGDPDPGRLRLHAREPRGALAPGLQDLHDLRGHLRDPAPRHRPGDLRAPYRLSPPATETAGGRLGGYG